MEIVSVIFATEGYFGIIGKMFNAFSAEMHNW